MTQRDDLPLLARLAQGPLSRQAEDVTSESLAVLLTRPSAAGVLAQLARHLVLPWGNEATSVTTQWSTTSAGTPDIAILSEGVPVAFIEAKFEAGLTDHQPASYLDELPQGGVCLFVVPQRRLAPLWIELCRRAETIALVGESRTPSPAARVTTVGDRSLGVVTWQFVTELLADAFRAADDRGGAADLEQFAGICEELEGRVAAPWDSQTLTGPVARQLLSLRQVIDEAVSRSSHSALVETDGLYWSASADPTWGKAVRLGGGVCYLHVNLALWAKDEPTPLWLKVGDASGATTDLVRTSLLAAGLEVHTGLIAGRSYGCVPVALAAQSDLSQDISHTAEILERVARVLSNATLADLPNTS